MLKLFPLILALATPAAAQETPTGKELYMHHCATCHGIDVDGNGPMAGVLVIKPVNLARLTVDNGGVFPLVKVIKRIDGRDPLVSHGSPMPVYGYFFEGFDTKIQTESGQMILTSKPIADLVGWIKSNQVK